MCKELTTKELMELHGYYELFRTRKRFKEILEFSKFKKEITTQPVEAVRDLLLAFRKIYK